jgi:uncharacterized integral membrane protein
VTREQHFERAQRSIKAAFFFMGLPIGTLVPRLAEIKAGIGASEASYGTAIAIGGVGALAGNYLGSHLVHHFGTRAVGRRMFYFIIAANFANTLAPNALWLGAIGLSSGFAYSITNIAMNSQGVLIEQGIGRSFLPKGHGTWSVGTMIAAALSSLVAPYCTPMQALAVMDSISIVGFYFMTRDMLPPEFDDRPHNDASQLPRDERIPRNTLNFLMLIALGQWLGLIAEISCGDWSSVLLHEHFHVPIGPNGYGFAVFMLAQLTIRLLSPRMIDARSLEHVVRRFAFIGAAGYFLFLNLAIAVHEHSTAWALLFSCLMYASLAIGVASMPAAFSSASGRIPGLPSARALMVVGVSVAIVNVGTRIGFSFLAQRVSLPLALEVMGLATIGGGFMAFTLDQRRVEAHAIRR